MLKAKVKRLSDTAVLPTRGSEKAAGWDLYADIKDEITINPHQTEKVTTNLAITPPEGYFGAIFARSGLATKQNLAPANKVGVCDEDYTGPYIVALHNHGDTPQTIKPKERIAQLVFMPYAVVDEFEEVSELEKTERGAGGFGSTGKQ